MPEKYKKDNALLSVLTPKTAKKRETIKRINITIIPENPKKVCNVDKEYFKVKGFLLSCENRLEGNL